MPVYNSELYIKDAIDSVLNQTFSDFEFIIIDDASTDKSVEIIQSYSDSRIQLIVKPKNSGYTNSLNYGFTIAKGEYIARMDSDDFSLPARFEKQVEFLEANPDVVACGTNYQILGTNQIVMKPQFHEEIKIALLTESCIGHPTVMLRNSTIQKHEISYQKELEPAEDYALWVRMLDYGKLHNLQEVLFLYRNHEGQVSVTKKEIQRNSASLSRLSLVKKIIDTITETEEIVYKKLFSLVEKFTYNDLVIYAKLKQKLLIANQNEYFQKEAFGAFLNENENLVYNQYFCGRKKYSPRFIFDYFAIKKHIKLQLSYVNFIKLVVKALTYSNTGK